MPGAGPDNPKVQNLLTGSRHSFYLTQAVEAERQQPGVVTRGMWPTPVAGMADRGDRGDLNTAVKGYASPSGHTRWPTPRRVDANSAGPGTTDEALLRRSVGPSGDDRNLAEMVQSVERGLWPTPRATRANTRPNGKGGRTLLDEARKWPTPTRRDAKSLKAVTRGANATPGGTPLAVAVMWATPNASEARQGWQDRSRGKKGTQESLSTQVVKASGGREATSGQLNPTWVEWLMGFPIGWSDCGHSGTPSCRKSSSGSGSASLPSLRDAE